MLRCATCHRRLLGASCPDDGWTQPAAPRAGPGASGRPPVAAGFEVGEPLGAGGFAVVWAAARRADGAPAVVKVGRGATPVIVERFQREAAAMERVGPPHTPELHARGLTEDGRPYLVMERLSGETLAAWIARQRVPPAPEVVAGVAGPLLSALEAAHARGVIHRDLKPENVFLAGDARRAVLLDFGLARRTDAALAELTQSGVVVGTPDYMAPEQLAGAREACEPADVYAIGVVLFEMLTLRLPFEGEPAEVEHGHLALRPPRPSEHAHVPPALEELVLSCLAKEPERRPAGAAALRRALEAAAALPAAPPPRSSRAGARRARLIAESPDPVVLAAIETGGEAGAVVDAVARGGGFIARRQGRRYVGVFSGRRVEDPARAALAAARSLVASQGARAALHLASVLLRRREGATPTAYGAAIDSPEAWMPAEPWSGVRCSAALQAAMPEGDAAPDAAPGESTAAQDGSTQALIALPLTGRDDVLAALEASARVPFDEGRPALFTIIGDHGLGKSRLAAEAASVARRLRPEALVVQLSAQAVGEARGLAGALLRAAGAQGDGAPDAHGGSGRRGRHVERDPEPRAFTGRIRALAGALAQRARSGPTAIVLDDAHLADADVTDALEYATLDGEALPLWVVVAAHPRFEPARPGWGARTRRHDRVALGPLPAPAAAALAAELLRPAEYPPAAVLERLATWSAGNPASLTQIARALKRAGVVKRRPGAASSYVATADIDALPPSPAWQWISTRRLAAMPPDLRAFARLCAVLGATFWFEELERVQDALERDGRAAAPLDVGYGLEALADAGILGRGPAARLAFRDTLFRNALYEMIDPAQRAAVHEQALGYWRWKVGALDGAAEGAAQPSGPGLTESLEALARHALAVGAAGAGDVAADALLRLGDAALSEHRHVDADQRYTAALAAMREGDGPRRMRALAGRGKSRVLTYRLHEAEDDLEQARGIASALGDARAVAELLLEEATALDWDGHHDRSAERVESARPLVEASGSRVLAARTLVADGRTAYRRGRIQASIELLERGLAAAEEHGDHDGQVIARLLLGSQLSAVGRLDDAAACFDRVISLTSGARDRAHLCVAYMNRSFLWLARQQHDRAVGDLHLAVALARELGNPMMERMACLNVAELLYWTGRSDDALSLTRRARLLEERFLERPSAWASLLLARILVSVGAIAEAREIVEEVERRRPDDLAVATNASSLNASLAMLRLILGDLSPGAGGLDPAPGGSIPASWAELTDHVERLLLDERVIYPDELLEALHWRARSALRALRHEEAALAIERAEPWLAGGSVWAPRFDELRRGAAALAAAGRITAHRPGVAGPRPPA